MTIKEYVKIQAKECKNLILKSIFLDLNDILNYKPKPYSNQYLAPYKKVKKSEKVIDNIQNKKIYILNNFDEKLKAQTTLNMKTGYKSTISEDIVADNGDIYDFTGMCQSYKFYKFNNEYYVRMEGSNVISIINKYNYDKFKSILESMEK